MEFKIYKNKEILAEELAAWMCELINVTLQEQEFFTLALSGGETPKILYKKLAASYKEKINWKKIQVFWGDERVVPYKDDRNNAKMAQETLLEHVEVPSTQIHRMRTDIEPVFSAKEYEKMLHTFFDNTSKSFDLVLLGMGEDGHTLSLFPHSLLIEEPSEKWVSSVYNISQQMYRITLTPGIVNRASHIAFMIDGPQKSHVLGEVIKGAYMPSLLPAQIIKPVNGELYWFLDEEAAKELNSSTPVR
ncbi:MAG TPA: 6-phosphogluconolactonase [Chitinophagaceae bacterium]|nr:6-phosphogluconolactonase [Chitinophagaceae bacterium]